MTENQSLASSWHSCEGGRPYGRLSLVIRVSSHGQPRLGPVDAGLRLMVGPAHQGLVSDNPRCLPTLIKLGFPAKFLHGDANHSLQLGRLQHRSRHGVRSVPGEIGS